MGGTRQKNEFGQSIKQSVGLGCIINYSYKKVSHPKEMDSAEIVYANVEEIIGKTGK